jgi:TonB family protein
MRNLVTSNPGRHRHFLCSALILIIVGVLPDVAFGRWAMDVPILGSQPTIVMSCDDLYPFKKAENVVEGTTTVSALVEKNGTISSSAIATSSGNADLDLAAKTCIARARFPTFKLNDQQIPAVVQLNVVWKRSQHSLVQFGPSSKDGSTCHHLVVWPPPLAIRQHGLAPTMLLLNVSTEGAVTKINLLQSSAWGELDNFVLSCYEDAVLPRVTTPDGTPTGYDWKVMVRWP